MAYLLVAALVTLVAAAAVASGVGLRRKGQTDEGTMWITGGAIAWLLLVGGWGAFRTFHSIPAGHVGIVYQFGGIVGQRSDGFQAVWPWQNVNVASVQIQRHSFDRLDSFSQETQDVFITATLNYEVSPQDIQRLFRTVGPDYFNKLVVPRVNQFFKDETVKFRSVDIAPNRDTIREQVRKRLKAELASSSIQVDDLLIDNIDFPAAFKKAIVQKQVATQNALREQQNVKRAEYEAQQTIATASGQARANRLLDRSLTQKIINYTLVQKIAPTIQTALIPSNAIVNTTSLFSPTAAATPAAPGK
jgi:regulator of protease activity HflC (stomatin/prohibitin superfamily)